MKFRELFSSPEGKRITEKYLYRVLISSICSILLCMGCLAGTTWAWFAVSIENSGNVIQIASVPNVAVAIDATSYDSGPVIVKDNVTVTIENASELDDVQHKSTLYVTFLLDEEVQGYVMLNHENGYTANVTISIPEEQESKLSWAVSWFKPDKADPVVDNLIKANIEEETDPTKDSTEHTDGETESIDETTQPSEAETEPAEETTQPAEEETKSTEGTVITEPDTNTVENDP